MFVLVLLTCVVSTRAQCSPQVVNNVGDFVLKEFISNHPDSITLPNVTETFFYDRGTAEASFGFLSGLQSLKRYGNIKLQTENNTADINLQVIIDYLSIDYQHYLVQLMGIKMHGILHSSVDNVVVSISASMGEQSLCFLTINSIKFVRMGKIVVSLGSDSKLTNSVITRAVNFFKNRIKSLIQAQMEKTLRKILKPGNSMVCRDGQVVNVLQKNWKTEF